MALSGGDRAWIIYQGPPRWDGSKYVNGDKFFLSGHQGYARNLGVDIANGATGLERESTEYLFDTPAAVPDVNYVTSRPMKRQIDCSINIYGSSPKEVRENARRWRRNHPDGNPGRLWVITAEGSPRYLPVFKSETAALGDLEKDPAIRNLYQDLEWGWVSETPYFLGIRETKTLKHTTGGKYEATFFNPSTVPQIYPVLYMPGPGQWTLSLGYQRMNFRTPIIENGETMRMDFNPKHPTFVKKTAQGEIVNLWPSMVGQRPVFSLEAETMNTFSIQHSQNSARSFGDNPPRLTFTPRFSSWI